MRRHIVFVLLALTAGLIALVGCKSEPVKPALVPVIPIQIGKPAEVGGLTVTLVGATWKDTYVLTHWHTEVKGDKAVRTLSWGDFRGERLGTPNLPADCPADTIPQGATGPKGGDLQPGKSEELVFCWVVSATLKDLSLEVYARPQYPAETPSGKLVIELVKDKFIAPAATTPPAK
ncbi:MAG: hypothetical protein EXR67_04245 [Dehalococcoidia bacterium]|nr:hypothetical protein [Dehalococcoidia bacterium]